MSLAAFHFSQRKPDFHLCQELYYMLRDDLWWIVLQQLQKSLPWLPSLLLCCRLLTPNNTSVLSWKSWLSTYIHLNWILDWIFKWVCTDFPTEGNHCTLSRQAETSIRRTGQLRVEALDSTTAILICQWWGGISSWCTTTICQQQIRQKRD